MKVKLGGNYYDATAYIKRSGAYQAPDVFIKSDGVYVADTVQQRLTISGSTILGYDGVTPITLRGVVFGAWGRELDTDPALYASWGANFVRLVMPRWWGLYDWLPDIDARDDASPNTGYIKASHITTISNMIGLLKAAGLIVQLEWDSDCGANGQQSQGEADYCRAAIGLEPGPGLYANFWTNPEQQALYIAGWVYLLGNLPIKPDIVGCLAEPQSTGAIVKPFYQSVMDALLVVDPQTIFALFGPGDGSGFDNVVFPERNNIIYEFNLLDGVLTNLATLPGRIAQNTVFRTTYNKPVYCDQLATKENTDPTRIYSNAGYSACNANNIHFAVWQSRAWSDAEGEYAIFYNPSSWILRTDFRDRFIYYCAQTYAALQTAAHAAATAESAVLFYVKADFSNCWQDSAGTTPVTAAGQPLGLMTPVIGSGLNLTQGTALARPTVTTIAGTGRLAMLFDAVNTYLSGSVAYFSSGSQMTAIAAGIPGDVAAIQDFIHAGGSGGNPKWPKLGASAAKVATAVWQSDTTTNAITGTTPTSAGGVGYPIVMSCTRDGSANKILYCNGQQDGATNSTADGTIAAFSRFRVGSGTSNAPTFNGPIGPICVSTTVMSAANRQAIERFAAYHVGSYYLI